MGRVFEEEREKTTSSICSGNYASSGRMVSNDETSLEIMIFSLDTGVALESGRPMTHWGQVRMIWLSVIGQW